MSKQCLAEQHSDMEVLQIIFECDFYHVSGLEFLISVGVETKSNKMKNSRTKRKNISMIVILG
jgi:hypothetical protein